MKEFDLKSIWGDADQDAKEWYEDLRPELIDMAKKQNDSVLHRLRRLAIIELTSGIFAITALLYYIRSLEIWLLVAATLFMLALVFVSFYQYRVFKQKADQVPTLNIVDSTKSYLTLIHNYKKRLNRVAVVLIPLSILVGVFLGFNQYDDDYSTFFKWETWSTLLPVLIALSLLSMLGTRWYYNYFIGSKENELQAVLNGLMEEYDEK